MNISTKIDELMDLLNLDGFIKSLMNASTAYLKCNSYSRLWVDWLVGSLVRRSVGLS